MKNLKVLIVDDEPLARELIRNYLSEKPGIEISAECADGYEALKAVTAYHPDLVFLDIQMPKIDGFEFLEVLDRKPEIIFTTAYDQYAIRAFEMNAVDYLLKPFSMARLEQAIEKARQRLDTRTVQKDYTISESLGKLQEHLDQSHPLLDRVVTRLGNKITVIPVDLIWYIEAQDDYVMIYSELGNHLKEKTMKYFEEHLPADSFIRIHRSYIVNLSQISGIELYEKDTHLVSLKSGARLKASKDGYKRLREKI
jgi:two-component system LytT family response regulator